MTFLSLDWLFNCITVLFVKGNINLYAAHLLKLFPRIIALRPVN